MARNVQTPGAAPKTTVDEEVKTTESETTEQQQAVTTPENLPQTGDAESETEPTVDESKPTEQQADATQPAETAPEDQVQTGGAESETESTVDQVALIEELRKQLEAAEAEKKALQGQLRRTTPAKTVDMSNASAEAQTAGTPYLSPKGWTRGA